MSIIPPRIRVITSPVERAMLWPLTSETVLQFPHPLTDREYQRVAGLLDGHPEVALRVYGLGFSDLEFLRFFSDVRRFQGDYLSRLDSIDGLRHLSGDLESLVLGATRTARQFSLSFLRRFPKLRDLYIEGHTKDLDVIGELTGLQDLTLRSVTLADLSILVPLIDLLSLDLKLGGTKDLGLLPRIGKLRHLELWQIRGLESIDAISDVPTLQHLMLHSLRRVDRLPDLSRLGKLRRVALDTMKGITDLSPLASAPALEQLLLVAMSQIGLDDLECLTGHPTLREAVFGLGSLKRNRAAYGVVGASELSTPFEFVE